MLLDTCPLHNEFGLEVLDVDLRQPTAELAAAIDALWVEHPVLLIRDQLLDVRRQQVRMGNNKRAQCAAARKLAECAWRLFHYGERFDAARAFSS